MNEITLETSWGTKLCFSPLVSAKAAHKLGVRADDWQGFANMNYRNANILAKKMGKRLPTSTELHELHLWLNKTSNRSWTINSNAYWSSTQPSLGKHCAVLLCNANCDCNSDERHCYVSCVSAA
jgi:hypothetical protein